MKLFWNNTDYNLILEKILDSKCFSSTSKSLLLSMIYKIENFYNDYRTVKNITKTKNEYLQEIIEIIKKYCDNIKLIEPDSKDSKILKDNNLLAVTNERERSILAYPTEISLLYAISDVVPKYFYIPDDFLLKPTFQQLLVNGYNENNLEILSDFNGWSWDLNLKFKSNIEDNLIYQNLIILFGLEFMDNWMNATDTEINQLEYIKKNLYNTKFFDLLCKFLNFEVTDKNKTKLEKSIEDKKKELEFISDKPRYFEDIKKRKMKYLKEVEKIDITLNDKELLRKQYEIKNSKLEEKNKIESINQYKKMLEVRREKCLEEIKKLTSAINPINYINYKRELEESINGVNGNDKDKEECLILLQNEFIKVLRKQVEETYDIETLKGYIFKIRYYRYLYLNENKQIKNIESLNSEVQDILKIIIEKLLEVDELKRIVNNDEINSEIIKNILDTKIMDLKEIRFEVLFKEGETTIRSYEREVYEKEFTLLSQYPKKDFIIKTGKIYKLFI